MKLFRKPLFSNTRISFYQQSELQFSSFRYQNANNVSRKKDPYQATLASQRLSSSHDFKGLVISPNANAIAFWTDKKVVLYTSESLTFSGGHAKTEPSEWELREAGCFFHSMFLTQKYLVASTIGQNFVRFALELILHSLLNESSFIFSTLMAVARSI